MRNSYTPLFSMFFLLTQLSLPLYSQKGIPAPEQTTAEVHTNYPQHQDFMPSLVRQLKVPDGYRVFVAASGLGKPRMMAVNTDGSLYITRRDAGDVLLLTDEDGDGKFDELRTVVAQFKGVHGISINNGWLYLCATKKLARGRINIDGTIGTLDTLINDLPDGGQHDNRTIAFGPDGKLYISIGSDCNDCGETNPEHATILQAEDDGSNRKVYARHLRNTIGFGWHPQTHEMWGLDHGSDYKGDTIPPEELNRIIENGDYGWPLVYGKQQPDLTREDPIGTTKQAYALTTQPGVLTFPAHSAPMALLFLNNPNVPSAYRDDALISWHGSWNRKKPEGFKVQLLSFRNGQPTATNDFLTGFLNTARNTRFGRPVALVLSPEGVLYVSDDANGVIYGIRKQGQQPNSYSAK